MAWTENDIRKTGLSNNLHEKPKKSNVLLKKHLVKNKISIEKQSIETVLWVLKRENKIQGYVAELQFHPIRKFRFDWAIPSLMIAIEYEGIFSQKSGHTTISGYTKDCDKYNLALILGWKVLRYTAKNYKQLTEDLEVLLKK